jgi:hypothetical protein
MIKFRGHTLVIGATGTGKGVLTAAQAEAWRKAGMNVYLLCNKQDEYEDFPADFKTMKQERLIEEVKKLRVPEKSFVQTMVVIDEAWDWKWKGNGGLQFIPNAARSHGVEMWVQSQFPTQMAPTVRANCQNIFCFLLQEPQAIDWAWKSYGEKFMAVAKLQPGQYIGKRGLGEPFNGCAWYIDKNGKFVKA